VTRDSITILRTDGTLVDARIPATGDLAAETIATRYNLADQVQLTRKPNLELKSLRRLWQASESELAEVVASLAWRREENLLKVLASPAQTIGNSLEMGQAELETARRVSLNRAANLPNFVADETAKRYTSRRSRPPVWKLVDTIESEVTFHNGDPIRQHVRINGKPWSRPDFPGLSFGVDFGADLKSLFDPQCGNSFDFLGRVPANGKYLLAYAFHTPAHGCFGYFNGGGIRLIPTRSGRVLVEDPAGNVVQYEKEAIDIAKGFGIDSWKDTERWDYLKIGEASYLLPISFDSYIGLVPGDLWHVDVTYTNHRHFEASTNLSFR